MSNAGFWNDKDNAREVNRERGRVMAVLKQWEALEGAFADALVLKELADEEDDADTANEAGMKLSQVDRELHRLEFQRMLGGENDNSNAILSINAGAGGTEAQDWSEMLLRMYLRWAEQREFDANIIEIQPGNEAGIQGVTKEINGPYAD